MDWFEFGFANMQLLDRMDRFASITVTVSNSAS